MVPEQHSDLYLDHQVDLNATRLESVQALKVYFDWNLWVRLAIVGEPLDPWAVVSLQVQVSSVVADYS